MKKKNILKRNKISRYILLIILSINFALTVLIKINFLYSTDTEQLFNKNNDDSNEDFVNIKPKNSDMFIWENSVLDDVISMAISDDGKYIVAGVSDQATGNGRIYFYSNASSDPIWTRNTGSMGDVKAVAISSNGTYIVASAGSDGKIHFFNKSSGDPLWTKDFGINYDVIDVDISADGKYIVVGANNYGENVNKTFVFHKSSSKPLWNATLQGDIRFVKISSDGNYFVVATGSSANMVYFFNTSDPNPLWDYKTSIYYDDIKGIDISANGSYFVVALEYDILFFNKTQSSPLWTNDVASKVTEISMMPNGEYMTAGDEDGVMLYNHIGDCLLYSPVGSVKSIDITSNGDYIIAGKSNRLYYFYNKRHGSPTWNPDWSTPITGTLNVVRGSANGRHVAVGTEGNIISLFHGPSPPSNFSLTTNADNPNLDGDFDLNWTEPIGVESYTIYVSNRSITEINSSIQKVEEGITNLGYFISLSESGTYYYLIMAHNIFGNTTSNEVQVTVKIPPKSFILDSNSTFPDIDGVFKLNWSKSTGSDNYSLYWSYDNITEINSNVYPIKAGLINQSYLISGLASEDYYYRAYSYNKNGNASSNCIQIRVRLPPSNFILDSNATDPDTDGIFTLNWSKSIDAKNYSIYYSLSPIIVIDGNDYLYESGLTNNSRTIIEFNNGKYYFAILAKNNIADTLSNNISVIIQSPPKPFKLSTDADDPDWDGKFKLEWTDSIDTDNYTIYRYHNFILKINFSLTMLNNNTISPWLEQNLPNGIYYYIIVACNMYGNTTSNCISIWVQITGDDGDDDDNDEDKKFDLIEFLSSPLGLTIIGGTSIAGITTIFLIRKNVKKRIMKERKRLKKIIQK